MYPGYNVIINTILVFVRLRNSSSTQTEQASSKYAAHRGRGRLASALHSAHHSVALVVFGLQTDSPLVLFTCGEAKLING